MFLYVLLNVVEWLTFKERINCFTVSSSCSTVFKSICRKIVNKSYNFNYKSEYEKAGVLPIRIV